MNRLVVRVVTAVAWPVANTFDAGAALNRRAARCIDEGVFWLITKMDD